MAGKKVLIVEDDFYIRKMFMRGFMLAGYEVEAAEEVDSALVKLKQQPFDAVILDIMLPKLSGLEILKLIRSSNEAYKNIPIFVVTNRGDEQAHKDAIASGAQGFFTKSQYDPQDIVKAIEQFLSTQKVN